MNLFNTSCKKATYLVSKKEENKLTWLEKIKLNGHLAICSVCRRFEQQSGFIGNNAKNTHEYFHAVLSQEAKEKIKPLLKD